jgi:rhodanese-related sulfurtransferase
MLNNILIIMALLMLVLILKRRSVNMVNDNVKNVTAEEANKVISENNDIAILDVRTQKEYLAGHIPGALLMPVGEMASRISEIEKYNEKPVLVYCASGGRSPLAVKLLLKNNFKNIYHLNSGISKWNYKLQK